ncbi:MAG: helix-hairpin-helix domain-containing protein [Candidatus Helarchaeota archaeon]
MKNKPIKFFLCLIFISLLIGVEVKNVYDQSKIVNSYSEKVPNKDEKITNSDYIDPPRKPFTLKNLVIDLQNVTSPTENDTDNDGLEDSVEWVIGTDPSENDTDLDGLTDYYEVFNGSDPLKKDSNDDGLPDYYEVTNVSLDYDNDGIVNIWDFDNDNDGVNDGVDTSPFANSTVRDNFTINILTDGKPLNIIFQIIPEKNEYLNLFYQTWDWPYDDKGNMQDLDNSKDDVQIVPWLRITPSVLPDQENVSDRGVFIRSDYMEINLNPTFDRGNIVAFKGNLYYPEAPAMNLSLKIELIWEITGNSDKVAKSILADNGKYVCVGDNGLLAANTSFENYENRSIIQWIDLGDNDIALKEPNRGFISVADNGTLTADGTELGDREIFHISQQGNKTGFKAYNNKFLTVGSGNILMANGNSFVGFNINDLGYYPDIVHLVSYSEPFRFTGFNIEENFGCNLSLYYSDIKNQTIAANMAFTYDFLRNSTNNLDDMTSVLDYYNISVSRQNQTFSDANEAYITMCNDMIPMVLDSLPDDQIYPVIIASEEASKNVDMTYIIEKYGTLGNSCTVDLTEEDIVITKALKTEFYNTTSKFGAYPALSIEEVLNDIKNWNLNDNTTRTLMMMLIVWHLGEVIITQIGNVSLNFTAPEDSYRNTIGQVVDSSLDALSLIVDMLLTYHAFKSLKFCYMTLAYKGGEAVLSNWQVYKIVRRTNPNVLKSLRMNRMLGVMRSGGRFGKLTRFLIKGLQTVAKFAIVLDVIGILVGIGMGIWAGISIAQSIGGRLGQELGAAYGLAASVVAIFTGVLFMLMFTNPFTAVLAIILIIIDLIFDVSTKLTEWIAQYFFGIARVDHYETPDMDMEGSLETSFDDKDNNGLDVGDRIEFLAHLVGTVTGHGNEPIIEDRSQMIPWISIEGLPGLHSITGDSEGDTASPLLNQTQAGSTGGTTLVDKYDSVAWIEPLFGMINYPVNLKMNAKYKLRTIWYHNPVWYFGFLCYHKDWIRGSITPSELTTIHFDVLPGNLTEFLAWGSLVKNDMDGDGITDDDEDSIGKSNKLIYDTDADGINDKFEIDIGLDPKSCDTDEDGLIDGYEFVYGTNATEKDTDDDGLYDFLEISGWTISFIYCNTTFTTRVYSDPTNNDTDNDGVPDGIEYWSGLNPRSIDTNGNGTLDVGIPPVEIIAILQNSTNIEQDILDYNCIISEFAVDSNGSIYAPVINVSDNTYFILKLDSNLTYIKNWSITFYPGKVVVDNVNEILYVENLTSPSLSSFVKFHLNGTGIVGNPVAVGLKGVGGLDVDASANFYVARNTTTQVAQIEKYYPNGTLADTFGSYGTNPDQFTNLTAIAVDNVFGIIYAIDGNRVMKLNYSDGSYLTTLPNGYKNMVDIITDGSGYVYVLDKFDEVLGEGCVRKFDHNGMEDKNFIFTNSSISPPWNLVHFPMRIEVDSNKNFYILENHSAQYPNSRFLKFKENETQNPPIINNTKYDWDDDGLWNLVEVVGWNTTFRYNPWTTIHVNSSPFLKDTDFDGLSDNKEFELQSNPWDPDTDNDGLSDFVEYNLGTEMLNYDTDNDGLNDSTEVLIGSDPINSSDTDGDGLTDLQEFILKSNPSKIDTDSDGANDTREFLGNSNLLNPDTDNDYLLDGLEYEYGTDPLNPDTDDDYLDDGEELFYATDPLNNDTDNDGAIDGMEVDLWLDPLCNDTDGDGLLDFTELLWGSNPYNNDTDYDGVPDGNDTDIQTNFSGPVVLAYDEDPLNYTGRFVDNLLNYTNVNIVSASELIANYTNATYIVLIGKPSHENDTVGGLMYNLLTDVPNELSEMMKNDSHYMTVRHGIWKNEQTIVMLSQAYYYDTGKVIGVLNGKNVSISQNEYEITYRTAPIMEINRTFYYGLAINEIDTLKSTDSIITVILNNWSLPTIKTSKFNSRTSPHTLGFFNGLEIGERPMGNYLDVEITSNGTYLDEVEQVTIMFFYKVSDLNRYATDFNGPLDFNENKLTLYWYNEVTGKWVKLTTALEWVIDMGINTTDISIFGESYSGYIWIQLSQLNGSLFAVGGEPNIPFWVFYLAFIAVMIVCAYVVILVQRRKRVANEKKILAGKTIRPIKYLLNRKYHQTPPSELSNLPLDAINGITKKDISKFEEIGLDTIPKLAAAEFTWKDQKGLSDQKINQGISYAIDIMIHVNEPGIYYEIMPIDELLSSAYETVPETKLKNLDIIAIEGIAESKAEKLKEIGILTIKDLAKASINKIQSVGFRDWEAEKFSQYAKWIVLYSKIITIRQKMDNIDWEIKKNKLILKIDISKEFGKSSTGKTIIVANSHGGRLLKGTEIYLGLVAYKYIDIKQPKLKELHKMQNIIVKLDKNNAIFTIDITKNLGTSASGKSIIIASSRGNKQLEGTDIIIGLNVYKVLKSSKKITSSSTDEKIQPAKEVKSEKIKKPPIIQSTEKVESKPEKPKAKKLKAEKPKAEKPKTEKPKAEKPKAEKPTPTKSTPTKKSDEQRSIKDKKIQESDISGLGPAKIKLLNNNGIHTIEDLLNCNPEELASKITGIGTKSLEKWIKSAKELTSN